MTAIVGILCKDGVVIGADSSATFGTVAQRPTIEQLYEKKIEVIGGSILVACTGAIGLAQRFAGAVHNAWYDNDTGSQMRNMKPLEVGKLLSRIAIADFQETSAPTGCVGALVAFPCKGHPELFEFEVDRFQPERKTEQLWYCSMGSAQSITDPFLGLMREVFWQDGCPSLYDAIFAATWTLEHAIQVNPGGVNGPAHIAALQPGRKGGPQAWILDDTDLEEHRQYIADAKQNLREFMTELSAKSDEAPDVPQPP